ncbi:MAG: sensor domain-containing diguanylate cyclase [Candidatus Acidiferrum sp.]|jgi:diguanylate cyclase (GGDEF)-like protein/PAS domain S-box-containing protein
MLTKIRERAADALLRREFLCGDGDFRTLAEAIACAIFISQGKRLHYVNHAAETITGYAREELLSMNFWDLVHPDCRELVLNRGDARHGGARQNEVKILTKSGHQRWLDISTTMIEFGGTLASLVSAFDLTERKHAEEEVQLLAVTDPLTGLGNYRRLVETLDAEVKRTGRTGRPFAVLVLDLDQLKKINDRYGHLIGSQALCRLADVLRVYCRSIDTAARYGGDEFVVILPETTAAAARVVASRIHSRLATDSLKPRLSASIGVAVYPHDGETMEALLRTADRELYGMKSPYGEEPTPLVCSFVSSPGRLVHKKTSSKKRDQANDSPEGESWIN